jgi:hypothetical protein
VKSGPDEAMVFFNFLGNKGSRSARLNKPETRGILYAEKNTEEIQQSSAEQRAANLSGSRRALMLAGPLRLPTAGRLKFQSDFLPRSPGGTKKSTEHFLRITHQPMAVFAIC